jgi:predicted MPP superfamily phosphohydrolase
VNLGLISDTHLGLTKEKILRRCLEEMSEQKPDIVVHAGDYCGGHTGHKSVRTTCRLMRKIFPDTPIVSVIGNHCLWTKGRNRQRDEGWVDVVKLQPTLSAYTQNLQKIREAFKEYDVHFLDEQGPFRHDGVTLVGHTGWYSRHVGTNDLTHLPGGLGGDTFRHLLKEADRIVMENLSQLTDEDTYRIFVSHFPVIDPKDYGWSEKLGEILVSDYKIRKFLNGHFHERHEGPLRYESGSDYGKPRYLMVKAYGN